MTPESEPLVNRIFAEVSNNLRADFPRILGAVETVPHGNGPEPTPPPDGGKSDFNICGSIQLRLAAINQQIINTVNVSGREIEQGVNLFLNWMREGTVVRIIGAGRARLAAVIPANRLAHGGARVYVKDDIMPMPHTIKGGGIIAASASGKTQSVLSDLRSTRAETKDVAIVGIAAADAEEFKKYCDIFIGIQPGPEGSLNPLRALADSEEYVISELLDAMVVAAGRLGGFVDTTWRIGHENIGPTGPYDTRKV
jgi:D-arabinose 5-phosphate isomerase GutQ